MFNNRYCDLIRSTLNISEEERTRYFADNVNYLTLNILTPNEYRFARNTIEKQKPDIFEVLDRLLFPCDPIRDWTNREVEKINERFRKVESLLGL